MEKEYETQIRSQIDDFIKKSVDSYIKHKDFEKLPETKKGNAIFNFLEESTQKATELYQEFKDWFDSEKIIFVSKYEFNLIIQEVSQDIKDNFITTLEKKKNSNNNTRAKEALFNKDEFVQYVLAKAQEEKNSIEFPREIYYHAKRSLELFIENREKTSNKNFKEVLNTSALSVCKDMIQKFQIESKFQGFTDEKPLIGNASSVYQAYKETFNFISNLELTESNLEFVKKFERNLDEIYNSTSNKNKCYIATMAYKSENHPKVDFLRNYRDSRLSKSTLGIIFIKSYYSWSPTAVRHLEDRKIVNKIIKVFLDNLIVLLKRL